MTGCGFGEVDCGRSTRGYPPGPPSALLFPTEFRDNSMAILCLERLRSVTEFHNDNYQYLNYSYHLTKACFSRIITQY